MNNNSTPKSSHFLSTLPIELRIQIYSYIFTYTRPIKLRQVIPGSRDLSILRVNKDVYAESIEALYDMNTVVVARNDFCKNTDPALKTPLKTEHARHLLITSFSRSIACTLMESDARCDVCQSSAMGLVRALVAMPRLRNVVVQYRGYEEEVHRLMEMVRKEGEFWFEGVRRDEDVSYYREASCAHRLRGPGIGDLDIRFRLGMIQYVEVHKPAAVIGG